VPTVVVLADAEDVGVRRVVSRLADGHDVIWWRFGVPEASVSVDADHDRFRLEQPGTRLTSSDFRRADLVVYKRRWLQPRPHVASELPRDADRAFSEREWSSLLEGLLIAEEHRSGVPWMNSPSAWALTANKLALVLRAARLGLDVPRFTVSTPIRPPARAGGDLVAKAISADEAIDAERCFTTARVSGSALAELEGRHLSTPSLLQAYVAPVRELRVYCVLGEAIAVGLTPSPDHVDIRYVAAERMEPTFERLPADLESQLIDLTRTLGLNYCSFDLLVAGEDGDAALVDITPAGSWDYFESDEDPFLSDALAVVIDNHLNQR